MAPSHYRCYPSFGQLKQCTVALCDGRSQEKRKRLINRTQNAKVTCPECLRLLRMFAEKPAAPLAEGTAGA